MTDNKIEIDIDRLGDRFTLDVDGERILVADKLSEIINKLETEVKSQYGIIDSKGKLAGLFAR